MKFPNNSYLQVSPNCLIVHRGLLIPHLCRDIRRIVNLTTDDYGVRLCSQAFPKCHEARVNATLVGLVSEQHESD